MMRQLNAKSNEGKKVPPFTTLHLSWGTLGRARAMKDVKLQRVVLLRYFFGTSSVLLRYFFGTSSGRVRTVEDWEQAENGLFFDFCKTAFKPYDLAVQVCLLIASHYLGSAMQVSSDGSMEEWQDAITMSQGLLGYGEEFQLN